MPSFDVVSELDMHEVTNAVDQANRELQTRYDFKGVKAGFELNGEVVTLEAEVDFQLQQMLELLKAKLTGRKIDIKCMEVKDPDVRSEEHTSELQSRPHLVCRLLLEKKKQTRERSRPSRVREGASYRGSGRT